MIIKLHKNPIMKYLSLILLMISTTVFAQDNFVGKSSKYKVKKNERFQISYQLDNSGDNFSGPNFKNFHILGGPNPSSAISIINGRRTSSTSYSYILKPKRLGNFKIPPATIVSNGNKLKSNEISIQVIEGKTEEEIAVNSLKDDIFIRVILDKNTAYQGEQIIVSYVLYFSENIQNIELDKIPSLKGFWQKDLDLNQKQRLGQGEFRGNTYQTYILKKGIIIPQKFGKLILDRMEATLTVNLPTKRRDMWGRWITKRQEMLVKSSPKDIHIKPLPLEGKPSNFTGAVGRLSINSQLSRDSINTNETITLNVQITGSGNLPLYEIPSLKNIPDIEAYEPKSSDKLSYRSSGISGKKEDQYILIPRHKGTYSIPGISFSYFDPIKKQYNQLMTPTYKLKVGGTSLSQNQQVIQSINKENIDFIGKDVLFIKTKSIFTKRESGLFSRSTFFIFWLIPILFIVLIYLFKVLVLDKETDQKALKIKKAGRKALKKLNLANGFIKKQDSTSFYSISLEAIYDYLKEKLAIDISDFQWDEIKIILVNKKVSSDVISELETIVENCQIANYGASLTSTSMTKDLEKAKEIITKLENLL